MIEAGLKCWAQCSTCLSAKGVDLDKIAAHRGRSFALWGVRTPCRLSPGCSGRVAFYLLEGDGRRGMWDINAAGR